MPVHSSMDEPFAHLSFNRIDHVGRFLRSTRSQFIITAPTTLDRAQFDPATVAIVLQKKRADEARPIDMITLVADVSRLWQRTDSVLLPRAGRAAE
jgi:hypothetical protein